MNKTITIIGYFSPIKNSIWYEVREIEIREGKEPIIKTLKATEYKDKLDVLPKFKPKVSFENKSNYLKQFNVKFVTD